MKHIVIVGGGFGGIYTAKKLLKHAKVTLINPHNYFLFTPMLHEVAVGTINRHNIVQPIRELLSHDHFTFIRSHVKQLNTKAQEIVHDHGVLHYDFAVIAIGATTHYFNIPGAKEHTLSIKTVRDAIAIRSQLIRDLEHVDQGSDNKMHVVIIGAGATGVEMSADICDFIEQQMHYYHHWMHKPKITIIQATADILPICNSTTRKKVMNKLLSKGIDVITADPVVTIEKNKIHTKSGLMIDASTIIWSGGVTPNEIAIDQDIIDERGFVKVNDYLQACDNVYALGDCARMPKPLPQLAQVATRQAKTVASNIIHELKGEPLQAFSFKTKGIMVSVGKQYAVAEIYHPKMHLQGRIPWFMKRHIYLMQLIGIQNKIKVGLEWFLNLIFPRDSSEI